MQNIKNNKNVPKKVAVYIGKFEPVHNAHERTIRYCEENFDETIVIVGSVNRRTSIKHPFDYSTIKQWILNVNPNAHVKPVKDFIYNETKWIASVEEAVYNEFIGENVTFTLVGHSKDETSYYLKEFPNFYLQEQDNYFNNLSGTFIREALFSRKNIEENMNFIKESVSELVYNDIVKFTKTEVFKSLVEEYEFYEKETEMFANYPFPETLKFMCSDAVVVCEGNVLLVERKIAPGKGIWALPGGFVNRNETFEACAIRELMEETKIGVAQKTLVNSIKSNRVFDHPGRNIGIPRVTNAFYITIMPDMKSGFPKLPKVKGSDDAAAAKWISIAEAKRMNLFDDHSDIIDYFTNSL